MHLAKPSLRDGKAIEVIQEAARALIQGNLVAFPTETVYGLGADGLNASAVKKIFQAKGRPADHPLILHVADVDHARSLAQDWPPAAQALADQFWPGPMTLILKRSSHVSDAVTGGQDTVGVRIPKHSVALSLLEEFSRQGSGVIAAPSANRFGGVSPTRARDVMRGLGNWLGPHDMILDGGDCHVGVESTIVDLSRDCPQILRPGGVSRELIDATLARVHQGLGVADGSQPRVSGSLESHYAPKAKVQVLQQDLLARAASQALADVSGAKIAVLCRHCPSDLDNRLIVINMPDAAHAYAQKLYATFNDLDVQGVERLLIEAPPNGVEWEAVRDRLQRASSA